MDKLRIIGMDFDLTLMDYPGGKPHIPEETKGILLSAISRGIKTGVVSGRYWWEMRDLLEQAGLKWGDPFPSFFVTREAFIYWLENGRIHADEEWNRMRRADMKELACFLLRCAPDWFDKLHSAKLSPDRWILWGDYGLEVHFGSEEEAEEARRILKDAIGDDIPLARVHRNRRMAHVVLATGGKGRSLLRVAETSGALPEQVLAIGDSLNDLDMLDGRYGFLSGAVGNAEDIVKEAVLNSGGILAEGRAGEGVGEIIKRIWTDA